MKLLWIAGIIVFRLINGLVVNTYFNPDEYWQSLEVAHKMVFGYGHLTWEWERQLRSYLHPLLFAALYWVLQFLRLDTPWTIMYVPRLLQGIFQSIGDVYTYKFARRWFGERVALWTLLCQVASWFTFYCGVRTFSNSLETVLVTVALYHWPWTELHRPGDNESRSLAISLCLAIVSAVIRPTSMVVWVFLAGHWAYTRGLASAAYMVVGWALPIGIVGLGISTTIDRFFYGEWVLVPVNFFYYNVLRGVADYYGSHPFHWYFTQGLPTVLGLHLPLFAYGCYLAPSGKRTPLALTFFVVFVYSLLSHKEFRFIFPILPIAMCYCGLALDAMRDRDALRKASLLGLLVGSAAMADFFATIHQGGSVHVMFYLQERLANATLGVTAASLSPITQIAFLMPCHSTPYYAYLHHNISMRFLDCSPSDAPNYVDEADRFFQDPPAVARTIFPAHALPSHVVVYSNHAPRLQYWLEDGGYVIEKRFFHRFDFDEKDSRLDVLLYQKRPPLPPPPAQARVSDEEEP